jgi:hypothetical protein
LSREPKAFTATGINIITLKILQETTFFAIKFYLNCLHYNISTSSIIVNSLNNTENGSMK